METKQQEGADWSKCNLERFLTALADIVSEREGMKRASVCLKLKSMTKRKEVVENEEAV